MLMKEFCTALPRSSRFEPSIVLSPVMLSGEPRTVAARSRNIPRMTAPPCRDRHSPQMPRMRTLRLIKMFWIKRLKSQTWLERIPVMKWLQSASSGSFDCVVACAPTALKMTEGDRNVVWKRNRRVLLWLESYLLHSSNCYI
jgi:hypothetical protein